MRTSEFIDKDVFALDEKIGKVKGVEVDPVEWKITHLEIELEKDIAESVLGAKKRGVRNMMDVSAIEKNCCLVRNRIAHKGSKRPASHVPRPVP